MTAFGFWPDRVLDIEVYDSWDEPGAWAQARFLVHGLSDVMWTNDPAEAAAYLQADLEAVVRALGGGE